jgi:hypothetical protein
LSQLVHPDGEPKKGAVPMPDKPTDKDLDEDIEVDEETADKVTGGRLVRSESKFKRTVK